MNPDDTSGLSHGRKLGKGVLLCSGLAVVGVGAILTFVLPPEALFDLVDRIRSTRSPGKTSPAMPDAAVMGNDTARIPGRSTAARKPLSPTLTTLESVTG